MNEAETRAELIDPALKSSGWGDVENSRIGREFTINNGRLQGGGQRSRRDIADYVLFYRGKMLAVIEAKRRDLPDTEGVGQAKAYSDKLQVRFAYSTNGRGIYQIDRETGQETYIDAYPGPQQLWDMTFATTNAWRDRFAAIPFEDKGGTWQARYYQDIAIDRTLEAIAAGRERILLTLATGTGKTFIAFQLAWKLFQSRWNLSREPSHRPRILFLADRNILADQAYNAFSAFPEDALVRIAPDVIRKHGRVPKNGSIFFTIFQTFMSGTDEDGEPAPNFGDYPPNFFDFIVIDECHRGGANDEGNWRKILEYFSPAVQLGLTATPKRKNNVDTYAYFGEPVYTYSLKEGINDGFLTPFRVKQISTTLDEYVYSPEDEVIEGAEELKDNHRYREGDFNRIIEIEQREAYRVKIFLNAINPSQKTLVFCATQDHALAVRNLINQMKQSPHPDYCVRVTANDGALGEQHLRTFQDNEKTIPTILTTSQKLSTGVDARNVRNIVLMRPINSMIEFKQIIGRGTRLFDGKDYFTIYDFVKAYEHFNDPEWDGEPMEPPEPIIPPEGGGDDEDEGTIVDPPGGDGSGEGGSGGGGRGRGGGGGSGPQKIKIRLSDGKERTIQHMASTMFYGPDGKVMSPAQFIELLFGKLPELFRDEDELRKLWGQPDTRTALLEGLAERGFGNDELSEIKKMVDAEDSDLFDVLSYIAYSSVPISRKERVDAHRADIFSEHDEKLQAFLDFVLSQYVKEGERELDNEKLPTLLKAKYYSINDGATALGGIQRIRDAFIGFQRRLYE
ncbi:type I restriction enzyme R subunit [Thalassospira sp. MBR-102]|uniref:EcoAI/FtnUII family type I restriction enzme subunit R n=1 Tax=Thalassospira sp. MBR-102 TaxID=3156466 RepID=UPI003391B4AA